MSRVLLKRLRPLDNRPGWHAGPPAKEPRKYAGGQSLARLRSTRMYPAVSGECTRGSRRRPAHRRRLSFETASSSSHGEVHRARASQLCQQTRPEPASADSNPRATLPVMANDPWRGKWAPATGVGSGIGAEPAEEWDSGRARFVLGRKPHAVHGVRIEVLPTNLALPDTPTESSPSSQRTGRVRGRVGTVLEPNRKFLLPAK
jgi:hypothetical protein